MNKKYIPGVIIVEGHHDVGHLSNLYESCYVITNGYDIPQKEIDFINALPEDTQIIVLTDNDDAGNSIRERVNKIREGMINIKVNAPQNSRKKGVAETTLKDIQNELDKYVSNKPNFNKHNLYVLGLKGSNNSSQLREKIINTFNLGICNTNTIEVRLNLLGINEEEIKKVINND